MTPAKVRLNQCPNGTNIEECPNMEAHDRRTKWYLNRGISVENILAMIVMVAGFVAWAMHQEGRMVIQETETKSIKERLERDRNEIREDIKDIKSDLKLIVEKVAEKKQ